MPNDADVAVNLTLVPTQSPAVRTPDSERIIASAEKLIVDAICSRINTKLGAQYDYSEPLRELLYRAWSLAFQLRNMEVHTDHLIVAYCTSGEALNDRFNGPLGDRVVPLAGAMIRLSGQRAVLTPPKITALLPHRTLEGWITEAWRRANARGATSIDLTTDFLGVLSDPNADPEKQNAILAVFNRTTEAERSLAQLDRVRRDVDSIRITAGHHRRDILTEMGNLAGTVTQSLSDTVNEISSVAKDMAASHGEAMAHVSSAANQHRADALAGITTFTENLRASLADTTRDIKGLTVAAGGKHEEAIASLTGDVKRLTEEIESTKVSPPSTTRIVGAVVGTLGIGLVLGVLTFAFGRQLLKLMQ
jgi:uncharacterized protein YbjQ (UPF0145 family)